MHPNALAFSSLVLPDDSELVRDPPPRCAKFAASFWETYDLRTVIYDVVYDDALRRLRIYCPKMLNFEDLFHDGAFHSTSGQLRGGTIRRSRHLDILEFQNLDDPGPELFMTSGPIDTSLPINRADRGLDGKNVLYTLSKDNKLDWIADWALHHAKSHGANAVVFCDNASSGYTPDDITACLASVPGIDTVRVLPSPHPFGPKYTSCSNSSDGKFLQPSLMNLCRDRFMNRARAILNVDVDELVVSHRGESIFDAASASRFGYVGFPGRWVYAPLENDQPTHGDHQLCRAGDTPCADKYCIAPQGVFGKRPMKVHSLKGVNRTLFRASKRFEFLHCRQISSFWKTSRRPSKDKPIDVRLPWVKTALMRSFGDNR